MKAKKELMDLLSSALYKPLSDEEIVGQLNLKGKEAGAFLKMLDDMEQEGIVFKTKKNKYVLPEKINLVIGTLSKNKKGFGFVIVSDGSGNDVFISPADMNGAMHGDKVAARLFENRSSEKTREGEIIKIIKRANHQTVGTFEANGRFAFVVPDDPRIGNDIFISREGFGGAKNGDKVVVKIIKWPQKGRSPEGRIIEVLGNSLDSGADVRALIRQFRMPEAFPEKVIKEAEKIPEEIEESEIARRIDLRRKTIITIDGVDAKDLDDAVSVEKLENGNYLLGVHIADVSHYVRENSCLDKEALKRGCSVYLIDQVIPMLPPRISNGICSLNPHTDRLTLSIEMEIDSNGKTVSHKIFESIINSKERMVYTDVSDIIEKQDQDLIKKYGHIMKDILLMNELAGILNKMREARGSIDFDFDEAYIHLNEDGIPLTIETAERRIANRIIEEFMLKANETIAEHFYWLEVPFVYRVHEKPDIEKMEEFKKFIYNFGYTIKGSLENVHPKTLNEIVKKVKGRAEEHVINTVLLRSMKKAFYSPECSGHFGLGVQYYCHFTSPIRRYPDLIIHRIIKETLYSEQNEKRRAVLLNKVNEAALMSSDAERAAQEIERELEKLKKAEYMSFRIGEEFDGIISGIASFGFFVEIENTIEGIVRIGTLDDDYYIYEKERYRWIGERTKKEYGIGVRVRVRAAEADIRQREIRFELV